MLESLARRDKKKSLGSYNNVTIIRLKKNYIFLVHSISDITYGFLLKNYFQKFWNN
jgi:hypothetical protein